MSDATTSDGARSDATRFGQPVRVVSTKYDGSPHYDYTARLLDRIGPLVRVLVPSGTVMSGYRGTFENRVAFTADFFTDDRWYNCYHNHWTTGRFRIESYANVALPARFDGETLRWVDLDLDVLIRSTGAVALVDVDEFVEHRVRYGYPDDLVRRATETADALLAAARRRAAPFDRERALARGGTTMDTVPLEPPDDPGRAAPQAERWRGEARALWSERWGSTRVVSRGRVHDLGALPGFVALEDGAFAGATTYRVDGSACEVVTLDALREGSGAGTALLGAVVAAARAAGCRRVWLVTTNDNTAAMRFYQRQGWRMAALHRGAVDAARALKPEIPPTGADDITIRDEVEFEREL